MRDAVHRNLLVLPTFQERAMTISAKYAASADGRRDASTAKYGFAMTLTTGLRVPRRELTRTGYVEGQTARPEIGK